MYYMINWQRSAAHSSGLVRVRKTHESRLSASPGLIAEKKEVVVTEPGRVARNLRFNCLGAYYGCCGPPHIFSF